jgi:L-threonylcarbamoyladenylate synthase
LCGAANADNLYGQMESGSGRSAVVLPTHSPALFARAVERAAHLLRQGGVVAVPTETVYGLAANAWNESAVLEIFRIKGRPSHNPIIVHVASEGLARRCVADWPELASRLARSFWPGPLTLVLRRDPSIPPAVTAGGDTVGIRWPSHPFMQALIRHCEFPLAAPSANPANRVSPTSAAHVASYFGHSVPLIVDGGQSQVGIESTVLDLAAAPPRILRPGMIHEEALAAVAGPLAKTTPSPGETEILRSPGQLHLHYSPKAKLVLASWPDEKELAVLVSRLGNPDHTHVICHERLPSRPGFARVSVVPHDPEAYARALYAELHRCDELGAQLIVVETPPSGSEWRAVRDRLSRAAARPLPG